MKKQLTNVFVFSIIIKLFLLARICWKSVVVLIIGILSSVALPQYTKAVERARATEAVVQMATITQAIDRYILANDWTNGHNVEQGLDIELPNSNKFFRNIYYLSNSYNVTLTHPKNNFELYAYRNPSRKTWGKYCYYYNTAGKGVCDGLKGADYTIVEGSL